ncbi:MAG: HAD family hydrolase [archaeon]
MVGKATKSQSKPSAPFWLVLDVHGVLIPSSEQWIIKSVAKQLGKPWWLLYLRWVLNVSGSQRGTISAKAFYEKVLGQPLTDKQFHQWIFSRYLTRATVPTSVVHELSRLKKLGWKLALLSDMNTAQAEHHRKQPFMKLFDEVLLSCETGLMKPFPSAFEELERRTKARKDHLVFADDLWFNIGIASLLGWRAVTIQGEKSLLRFLRDLH